MRHGTTKCSRRLVYDHRFVPPYFTQILLLFSRSLFPLSFYFSLSLLLSQRCRPPNAIAMCARGTRPLSKVRADVSYLLKSSLFRNRSFVGIICRFFPLIISITHSYFISFCSMSPRVVNVPPRPLLCARTRRVQLFLFAFRLYRAVVARRSAAGRRGAVERFGRHAAVAARGMFVRV